MPFVRRGHVPHPYRGPREILIHLLDGSPQLVAADRINCFEEHSPSRGMALFTTIYLDHHQCTILETFDDLVDMLAGKAVSHVG